MSKIDLLIVPNIIDLPVGYPPDKERKILEISRKIDDALYVSETELVATKGLAGLVRELETRLQKYGIPYIVVRGLEPASEKDIEEITIRARDVLRRKLEKEYGMPVPLKSVKVYRAPRYDEWKDPPEEGSALDWLWLAVGVAGAIAVSLLSIMLKK